MSYRDKNKYFGMESGKLSTLETIEEKVNTRASQEVPLRSQEQVSPIQYSKYGMLDQKTGYDKRSSLKANTVYPGGMSLKNVTIAAVKFEL